MTRNHPNPSYLPLFSQSTKTFPIDPLIFPPSSDDIHPKFPLENQITCKQKTLKSSNTILETNSQLSVPTYLTKQIRDKTQNIAENNEIKSIKGNINKYTRNNYNLYISPNHSEISNVKTSQLKSISYIPCKKTTNLIMNNSNLELSINCIDKCMGKQSNRFNKRFKPPLLTPSKIVVGKYRQPKCSSKKNGIIEAYAVNTHNGLIK